ncbi:hypothetical protein ACFFJI_03325 [Allobacillus sp. GCM10007491]|uniref:Phr family secreted Rap phosphatase inhibitor n=1 Tax=Allobacillus saliphilus TaxID=2912308 RepID=A0A941CVY9_9BACI|nr:hypothetical protein [Allobacillus saliphilus]MBR7553685.1 hypothetical protein [Allobacillus saliphilus]
MKKFLSLVAVVLIVSSLYGFDVSQENTSEEAFVTIQGIGKDNNDLGSLD